LLFIIILILLISSITQFSLDKKSDNNNNINSYTNVNCSLFQDQSLMKMLENISLPMVLFSRTGNSYLFSHYINVSSLQAYKEGYDENKDKYSVEFQFQYNTTSLSNIKICNGRIQYPPAFFSKFYYKYFIYYHKNNSWYDDGNGEVIHAKNVTVVYKVMRYIEKRGPTSGFSNTNCQILILDHHNLTFIIGLRRPFHYVY